MKDNCLQKVFPDWKFVFVKSKLKSDYVFTDYWWHGLNIFCVLNGTAMSVGWLPSIKHHSPWWVVKPLSKLSCHWHLKKNNLFTFWKKNPIKSKQWRVRSNIFTAYDLI